MGVNISTKGIDITSLDRGLLIQYGLIAALAIAVLAAVILITQAIRNIPVTYSRGVRAGVRTAVPSHLSLRLNSAGVIPIIFAISILITPAFLAQFFLHARSQTLQNVAQFVISITKTNSPYYAPIYFLLVVVFTFFYTFVVFQPKKIAENLSKQSGFIPGVRPGTESERYLHNVILRLTVFGALFLGLVAILPAILQNFTGTTTFTLGGTGLLIVVSVIIETMLAIRAQIVTATYDTD
ncbi:MAG: Protein translocase subunit SecY [Candidatus Jorgensenbacteria bacterium GW2011_GWA2_45_9]|uniref:Protein translocase subunit SecY n=1 Tax=Candidatus Jorgensenbacteria bacterium GW2011_GWA2_45_9 TaxID=1618663 RepID=A0A0G1N3M0_9BACT|nr:MAG: Protein translocase subunit SecY [Candidatus Jorgensenbacteria bacterium GW2011_GWA2_45_9]